MMSAESTVTSNAVVIPTRILSREWVSYLDDDNDEYYYNLITHETTWDYPLEASNIKIENNRNNNSNNNNNNITIITNATPSVNNNTSSNEITNINGKSNTIITDNNNSNNNDNNNDNNNNNNITINSYNDTTRMGIDQTIPSSTAAATTLEVDNNTNISSNNIINIKLEVVRTKNLDVDVDGDDDDNGDNDGDKTELELPTPWIKYLTKDGYEYYYNPITKITTWEFPTAAATSSTATYNQSVVADPHYDDDDGDDISPHILIVETNESLNISQKESSTTVDESNIESTTKSVDSSSGCSIVKESKDESRMESLFGKESKMESLVGKESKKESPSNSKASAVSGFLKRLMSKKPPQKSSADIASSSSSSSSSSSIAVTATEAVDVIPTTTVVPITSGLDNNAAASTILSDDDCKIDDDNRVKETDHGTMEILQGIKAIDHESGELSAHNDDVALQLPSSVSSSSSSSSTKAVIEGSRINKDIITITSSSDIDTPPPLPWLQFKNDRGSSVSL